MKKFLLPLALFAATTLAFAADEKKSDTPDTADKACCEEKKASDKCDKPCCKQDGAEKKATEEKKA